MRGIAEVGGLPTSAGVLVGNPTTDGVYQMTYRVTDVDGDEDALYFTIIVNEAAAEEPLAFQISVGNQSYTVGTEIDVLTLPEATGGVAPLRLTICRNRPLSWIRFSVPFHRCSGMG